MTCFVDIRVKKKLGIVDSAVDIHIERVRAEISRVDVHLTKFQNSIFSKTKR